MSCPSVRSADAETNGFRSRTQMSLIRYLDVGLSVQSRTRSYSCTIEAAFEGVICVV